MAVADHKCPSCGAPLKFNPKNQKFDCSYCKSSFKIEDLEKNSLADMMFISKAMFTHVPKEFNKEDIKKITMNEDKSLFITFNDDSMEIIDNPLIIEDLKILL